MIVTMLLHATECAIRCIQVIKTRRVLMFCSIFSLCVGALYFGLNVILHPGFVDHVVKFFGG